MRIGTPDDTYGIVGASVLLAEFIPSHGDQTVTPPPNTQTLLLVTAPSAATEFEVVGSDSGLEWEVYQLGQLGPSGTSTTFVVPINTAVDRSYLISAPGHVFQTFVVAEQGIRAVADCTLQSVLVAPGTTGIFSAMPVAGIDKGVKAYPLSVNAEGELFTVSVPPTTVLADQQTDEILYKTVDNVTGANNVLAAPGAGKAYRLFFCEAYPSDAAAVFALHTLEPTGATIVWCNQLAVGGHPPNANFPISGFLIKSNTPVVLAVTAGHAGVTLGYQLVQ